MFSNFDTRRTNGSAKFCVGWLRSVGGGGGGGRETRVPVCGNNKRLGGAGILKLQ